MVLPLLKPARHPFNVSPITFGTLYSVSESISKELSLRHGSTTKSSILCVTLPLPHHRPHIHTCTHKYMYIYVHTTNIDMHVHSHRHARTMHAHTHILGHTAYMCNYVHAHTHTHTHTLTWQSKRIFSGFRSLQTLKEKGVVMSKPRRPSSSDRGPSSPGFHRDLGIHTPPWLLGWKSQAWLCATGRPHL